MAESNTTLADLQSVSFLDGVCPETLEKLSVRSFSNVFPAGVILCEEGETPGFVFILLDGMAERAAQRGTVETVLSIVNPVSAIGLPSFALDRPLNFRVRTIKKSHLLLIPSDCMREACSRDAGLATALMRVIAEHLLDAKSSLKEHKLLTSIQRLAQWLIANSRDRKEIQLPFEKRRLAGLIGTTPENLSRSISQLQGHGVEFAGTRVRIHNPDALRVLVQS